MLNDFFFLKLNRAVFVALLDDGKLTESISYFENYLNDMAYFEKDKKYKKEAREEIDFAKSFFISKLVARAYDYYQAKDYNKALICYTELFKLGHKTAEVLENYVSCLDNSKLYDLELEMLDYLKEESSKDNIYNKLVAAVCAKLNKSAEAVEYYEKYLAGKTDKKTAAEYNALGCYYNKLYEDNGHQKKDIDKSIEAFINAEKQSPHNKLYQKNITIMATKAHKYDISREYWDKILSEHQLSNDDKYDYSAFCLQNGELKEWYKYFDARFKKESSPTPFPKINKPCWDGTQDISDKILLVHCEQGYGDTFLMWGYIPRLKEFTNNIIFVVQEPIYPLLVHNNYGVVVYGEKSVNLNELDFDYYIPSMSIPIALRLDYNELNVGNNYINANLDRAKLFKNLYFNNDKLKIGISFKGNPAGDLTRDIPLKEFLTLDKLDNVQLYCFSKDIPDCKFADFNNLMNIAQDFNDFSDTAAALENLDLMVTSDSCMLNLSAALGKKTYGVFNWNYNFRYFDLDNGNVGWYDGIKPFINDKMDNWQYSFNNIVKEIKKEFK